MAGLLDNPLAIESLRNAIRDNAREQMTHRPQRPVGMREFADAMQMAGLFAAPVPVLGDVAGLFGDAAMYAAKPEERTLGNLGLTALGALPFLPSIAGKAKKVGASLDISDAVRSQRLIEQDYTRGMWRGGAGVADGPHYTPDPEAAAAFAKRHGAAGDVREYALRMGKVFDVGASFGADDLRRIADAMAPYNKAAAKELPSMAGDFRSGRMPGGALWQVVDRTSGGNGQDLLRAAGYDSINAGQEVIMLRMGNVRDANRAAFDPAHVGKVGPFLGLSGAGLFGLLGGPNDDSSK